MARLSAEKQFLSIRKMCLTGLGREGKVRRKGFENPQIARPVWVEAGEEIVFSAPAGNFDNAPGCEYARRMILPVRSNPSRSLKMADCPAHIGEKGQFPRIGGEEIIERRLTAHLRRPHH